MKYPWQFENLPKSSSDLQVFVEKGKSYFLKRHFDSSLDMQLAILCYALPGSEQIPLAYSIRSAIYCEVGNYALAIENIAKAIETGIPDEKKPQLMYREEYCKTMMQKYGPAKNPDISSLFKLSQPPHSQIPFIADCLKLGKDERFGKHIVTTKDLKAGDVIAVETAVIGWPSQSYPVAACNFCGKTNHGSLYPCHHCASGKLALESVEFF